MTEKTKMISELEPGDHGIFPCGERIVSTVRKMPGSGVTLVHVAFTDPDVMPPSVIVPDGPITITYVRYPGSARITNPGVCPYCAKRWGDKLAPYWCDECDSPLCDINCARSHYEYRTSITGSGAHTGNPTRAIAGKTVASNATITVTLLPPGTRGDWCRKCGMGGTDIDCPYCPAGGRLHSTCRDAHYAWNSTNHPSEDDRCSDRACSGLAHDGSDSCGCCADCCQCPGCPECGDRLGDDECSCGDCCDCWTCDGCANTYKHGDRYGGEDSCLGCEQCDSCCECVFCLYCCEVVADSPDSQDEEDQCVRCQDAYCSTHLTRGLCSNCQL